MPRGSGSIGRPEARAALVALALAATACPGSRAPRTTTSPSPTPPRGGEVLIAYPNEPASLDPFSRAGDAPATRDLTRLVMPALERVGPAGERRPWLLDGEPVVSEGPPFAVTVTLRADAVWSDGRPITAADLRFTWRTAASRASSARDGYDRIADVVAETPRRARIVFRSRFARWRDLFSAGLGVLPAHALRTERRLRALASGWRVSGGPFVLSAWRRGLDMVFERNPRTWGGSPPLERLRVAFVPDPTTALALLRRGEVDGLAGYRAPDLTRLLRAEEDVEVLTDSGATWCALVLGTASGPFRERAVRRAFARAFDRARVVRGLVQGEGTRLDTPAPTLDGARATAPAFDPGGARRILAGAGWRGEDVRRKGGRELSVTLAYAGADALDAVVARAIQRQAAAAGVEVRRVNLDADRLLGSWLGTGRLHAALVAWRDPPGGALRARFGTPRNAVRLDDPAFERAAGRGDRAGGAAAYDDALDRLGALAVVVPLYRVAVALALEDGIGGARASASVDGPLWNAHEWYRAA